MILATPRTLFAFARDGFLPPALARVHPVHRTPVVAILVQCAIVLVLAITSTFERLAILANLSILVLYGMCCVATWQLRRRDVRAGGTPFRVPAPAIGHRPGAARDRLDADERHARRMGRVRNRPRRAVGDFPPAAKAILEPGLSRLGHGRPRQAAGTDDRR